MENESPQFWSNAETVLVRVLGQQLRVSYAADVCVEKTGQLRAAETGTRKTAGCVF